MFSSELNQVRKKINNGYPVCKLTIPLTMEVDALVALSEDKLLLGGKEELQLFEGQNKTLSEVSKEHNGRINCLIRLSDGKIVSGGQDSTIKVWDIEKKTINIYIKRTYFNDMGYKGIAR